RRHTRWPRDWSSDVCSSDLQLPPLCRRPRSILPGPTVCEGPALAMDETPASQQILHLATPKILPRSGRRLLLHLGSHPGRRTPTAEAVESAPDGDGTAYQNESRSQSVSSGLGQVF